jgi:hypothetical protein
MGTMREGADMKSYTKQKTETDRKERRSFLKKYLFLILCFDRRLLEPSPYHSSPFYAFFVVVAAVEVLS